MIRNTPPATAHNHGLAYHVVVLTADFVDSFVVMLTAVESANATKLELSKNCLEAHQVLMNLSAENTAKFKDVAKFFAEDVAKQESAETASKPG